ncbi:hypothetical protein GCM10017567_84160 [Amycolatopsis bullii]|uniref:Uncharacterized protein n=1 Tax=Amycolatopsis bullii TaxID=941987 RepID=A0ABQ3KRU5_9PSEU|nr:hypothetical protein GCM10017567_84160 [Amycolatopsis bullii]
MFARISNAASKARTLGPVTGTGSPSRRTCNGPSTPKLSTLPHPPQTGRTGHPAARVAGIGQLGGTGRATGGESSEPNTGPATAPEVAAFASTGVVVPAGAVRTRSPSETGNRRIAIPSPLQSSRASGSVGNVPGSAHGGLPENAAAGVGETPAAA